MLLEQRYGRFLCILVATAGLTLATISLVNFTIDPANIFRTGSIEGTIAANIIKGKYVHARRGLPYTDRLVQKSIITQQHRVPNNIVLGSSRSGAIRAQMLNTDSFFNHWVGTAVLEDYYGLIYAYYVNGEIPKNIILEATPWMLNRRHGEKRWKQVEFGFVNLADTVGLELPPARYSSRQQNVILEALISFDYFFESLQFALEQINSQSLPFEYKDTVEGNSIVYRPDGSFVYNIERRTKSTFAVDALARKSALAHGLIGGIEFTSLDWFYQSAFRRLIDFLIAQKVTVKIFLSPFHPAAWEIYEQKSAGNLLHRSEAFYREIGEAKNIEILGSFDPSKTNCHKSEFIDAHHAHDHCIEKLVTGR